jgi:RNA polymerase sigma factor (sigma-70 family)
MNDRHGLGPLLERVRRDRDHDLDPEAWSELVGRLRALARAVLALKVRQSLEASDLAHDAVARVLRHFGGFRGETVPALLAWFNAILASVLADYRRRVPGPAPLPDDAPAPPPATVAPADDIDRVLRAVERLAEPGRSVVRAFYLEGRPCVQIAADMGRSDVWVRVTKLNAVRALRELLGGVS